jgi:hypothetical protein
MLQSRREFLIGGTGAVLGTAFPRVEVVEMLLNADVALLANLTPWELELVQEVMDNYPALSLAKCIEMLQAAGM